MRLPALICIVLMVSALAGCANTPAVATGGTPRCDRTGDEDQRRRC